MSEVKDFLESTVMKQVILYAVQKQMFCPNTGCILDVRTCVLVEIQSAEGKDIYSQAVAPSVNLQGIKDKLLKINPAFVIKFHSQNKKLKDNPLITMICQ